MRFRILLLSLLGLQNVLPLSAQSDDQLDLYELSPVIAGRSRVAIEEPPIAYPQPVTSLRFEPLVDLQVRNLAESQGDVSIRGGIFENSGFRIGAATLFDPQTGHYFAEIPVPAEMLGPLEIYTGVDNALYGFNSGVGTLAWGLARVEQGGSLTLAYGQDDYNLQRLFAGGRIEQDGFSIAGDIDLSRSESDGTVPFGDHDFDRIAGRVQIESAFGRTDLIGSYQSKFFGWPNLYTPFGFNETEDLETTLILLNHQLDYDSGQFRFTGYYRKHLDIYTLERTNTGIFQARHRTEVFAIATDGFQQFEGWRLRYAGQLTFDDLPFSTSLTAGPSYSSRAYGKLALTPETEYALNDAQTLELRAGGTADLSDRDDPAFSPLIEVALRNNRSNEQTERYYLQYSQATQLPGYTVLKSAEEAGLFRGNAGVGRERSRNIEAGVTVNRNSFSLTGVVFYRMDDDLVDWVFLDPDFVNAENPDRISRKAEDVDIDTFGFEAVLFYAGDGYDITFGYTFLSKEEEYGTVSVAGVPQAVTGSFYAGNFARHRATFGLTVELPAGFELRTDNELRLQENNVLRGSDDVAFISILALHWTPEFYDPLRLTLAIDNLFDDDFEEIPSVPASRRHISVSGRLRF